MAAPRAHFGSDNASGVAPEIMAALAEANRGGAAAYGEDGLTRDLDRRFSELFETEVQVLPVGTGSVANALALSFLAPPWGAVYCHQGAHIVVDEANGPEFFGHGLKLACLPARHGRLDAATLRAHVAPGDRDDVHRPMPAALSIAQASEWGTIYGIDHLRALGEACRALGLAFHMDGARFANAVAALGCAPAEIAWKAGVDLLSFGATKNGAMAAEALVAFGDSRRRFVDLRRLAKRAGQLYSKARFIAAQLHASLEDDRWLAWATHANAQAARLAAGLATVDGVELLHPVEANEIFLAMPQAVFAALEATGFGFYPPSAAADGRCTLRLVTAFDTRPGDVERLIAAARAGAQASAPTASASVR